MTDLSLTIDSKVDQLTADELLGGPRTITVERVSGNDNADQPVSIHFVGDNGKPFKPCKTMRRLLVNVWGPDGTKYKGRRLTVYRDGDVKFGGLQVGGVRISHVSDIREKKTVALTQTRGKKASVTVHPLPDAAATTKPVTSEPFDFDTFESLVSTELDNSSDPAELTTWWNLQKPERMRAGAQDKDRAVKIAERVTAKISELSA